MVVKLSSRSELDLFTELERREVTSQLTLSKRVAVSVGLINALLKRAIKKGYVKAKAAPYKRYAYYLTPQGFREKSRLVSDYLETSLSFFRLAREEYTNLMTRAKASGCSRFVLVGEGELVEIATMAAQSCNAEIIAHWKSGADSSHLCGSNRDILSQDSSLDEITALLIVESRKPQEVFDQVNKRLGQDNILAPDFLKISRKPIDFTPPKISQNGRIL